MSDSLADEFRERQALKPDKYTLAWWQKQYAEVQKSYRGVMHICTTCMADFRACWDAVRALRERCDKLEADLKESHAVIGELQSRLEQQAQWAKSVDGVVKELRK